MDYQDKSCYTCEFNCGSVCAGSSKNPETGEDMYGCSIDEAMRLFPNGCDDWGISYTAFKDAEREKKAP